MRTRSDSGNRGPGCRGTTSAVGAELPTCLERATRQPWRWRATAGPRQITANPMPLLVAAAGASAPGAAWFLVDSGGHRAAGQGAAEQPASGLDRPKNGNVIHRPSAPGSLTPPQTNLITPKPPPGTPRRTEPGLGTMPAHRPPCNRSVKPAPNRFHNIETRAMRCFAGGRSRRDRAPLGGSVATSFRTSPRKPTSLDQHNDPDLQTEAVDARSECREPWLDDQHWGTMSTAGLRPSPHQAPGCGAGKLLAGAAGSALAGILNECRPWQLALMQTLAAAPLA